jgi:undecaprenyl-diphosphatase
MLGYVARNKSLDDDHSGWIPRRVEESQGCRIQFLLGLITLTAAAAYKSMTKWEVMQANLEIGPVLFGCLIAGASAATSVVWLVGYLARRGLGIFVWYRILLAAIILSFYFWQT